MRELTAEGTLRRSEYFLDRAAKSAMPDPSSMLFDLEAAIVFSRSVTFHLQKELSAQPGFREWYGAVQERLENDPVARFLLKTRNFILKEGPPAVQRQIVAIINEAVEIDEALQIRVKRGSPWYQRTPRILLEDTFRPFREWQARREHKREMAAKRARNRVVSGLGTSTTRIVFSTAPVADQSVFEVIAAHLTELRTIVKEARERFRGHD